MKTPIEDVRFCIDSIALFESASPDCSIFDSNKLRNSCSDNSVPLAVIILSAMSSTTESTNGENISVILNPSGDTTAMGKTIFISKPVQFLGNAISIP